MTEPPSHKAPRRLRAYALTQGRTHVEATLGLDAMLQTRLQTGPTGPTGPSGGSPEQQRIVQLCATAPQTLADLSAALDLPLQVIRVLLADLLSTGVLSTSSVDRALPPHHDLALLEEVLDGIESL
jgi:hypothetical protein